jgi:cell division septum initiation protein DivIVA
LNDEFEKVKDDPIKSKKLAKELKDLSKAVDDTTESLIEMNSAGELAGTKFDELNEVLFQTNEEVLPLTSQIGEMEDRMYQLAQANQQGSKEFKALQEKVVAARKTIIETDRSIDAMTENAGSLGGITSAFGELGESIFNLDFKRAGTALKGLGTQFAAFGKVLLANPIFLIVAVVAAIIVGLVSLRDKIKFVSDIFAFFGDIIGVVVQALKDFLDWLGLTDFAEQDLAEARKKRAEENIANINRQSDAQQAAYDRQIALANAEGKSTVELERLKQQAIIETARARNRELAATRELEKAASTFTKERNEELNALIRANNEAVYNAQNAIDVLEANATKNYKDELKKRSDAHKAHLKERLDAERSIQDLELQLMAEAREKMLLQNEITYERLRENTLANEKLTKEEQLELTSLYDQLEAQNKLDILVNNLDQELEIRREHEDKIDQLSVRRTNFIQSQASKDLQLEADVKAAKEKLALEGLNVISQLTDAFGQKNEKAAKRAFQIQKAISIAQAVIDTYKGANAIFASAAANPQSVLFPAQPFITAGLAIAAGVANVAKIAQTQFGGGSTPSASSPSAPSLGGGGGTSASASTPSFELFGQPNQDNNVSAVASQETNQMTVKAVVVESDITSTQNKVSKMKENAEL